MEGNGDGAVLGVLLHRVGDVQRALLLVLQRAVGEVRAPAHKSVCQIGALQDGGGTEHLVDLDHCLCLTDRVHVERTLRVVVLLRSVQNGFHGDQ